MSQVLRTNKIGRINLLLLAKVFTAYFCFGVLNCMINLKLRLLRNRVNIMSTKTKKHGVILSDAIEIVIKR